MGKKGFIKILIYMVLFVVIQTYFQNSESFTLIMSRWTSYFVPLIWAVLIAILLEPVVNYFDKKLKKNKIFSVIIALVLVVLIVVAFVLMVVPQIILTVKELNNLYPYILEKVRVFAEKIFEILKEKNITLINEEEFYKTIMTGVKNNFSNIQEILVSLFKNIALWTAGIAKFSFGLMLAILILLDKERYIEIEKNIIKIIFGETKMDYVLEKLNMTREIFLNYISGKLMVSFVVGLAVFLVLFVTKTPYALLSGVLLGLGNMIPYVGSIVGSIVAGLLIVIVSPYKILYLGLAIFISQLIDGFVLGPKIIGEKVGLSAFWVFISMIIFGGLFGILGMFLGVPLMCVIKMFYRDLLKYRKEKDKKLRELR
ncbi:MAG: AI-2E family transporter [Fusobacterium sp.]|nr:AI-2E family transporter [Fusobacterium sp.]